MKSDFSKPQRQSLVGVVVMFADTLRGVIKGLWPLLIVWIFRLKDYDKFSVIAGAVAIIVFVAVIAYLKYLNFTFFLDEKNQEFVIRHGILNKSRLAIPLDKIQQVNINQSLIQRVIDVYALEVDTAGSSKKEVSIRAINHDLALLLKERLLENEYETNDDVTSKEGEVKAKTRSTEKEHPFIQISLLTLFKTGITSNYTRSFALLFAFVVTTYQYIEDFIEAAGYEEDTLDSYFDPELLLRFITFIIVGILFLTLFINLGRTIIRYFGFKITRKQNSLLLSHGLLSTKSTIIRPEKVQLLVIGRNFFQKKLGIQDIRISQAFNQSTNKKQLQSAIEIPGCDDNERDTLLKFLLNKIPDKGVALKPSIRKLIFMIIKSLVIPIGVFFFISYLSPEMRDYIIFLPIYIIFVGLIVFFSFRNYRLFVNNDFIIKKGGAWDVDTQILAPHKIQGISLTQYFWHKSSDIGIVTLHTAGGNLIFGLTDYTRLKELTNYWLYQVETTDKNWM